MYGNQLPMSKKRDCAREISNFPVFENGTLIFCDDSFNHIEIEDIFCKYASYSGVLIWDKIHFFCDCDDTLYCDRSVILDDKEHYYQGDRCFGGARVDFTDNPFPQYSSNSVRFCSEWGSSTHEIVVVTEVRSKQELEKVYTMLEDFEQKFGKPRKQYMWSGFSYDD